MSAIYDILETLIGTPIDAFQSAFLYLVATILAFMIIFALFDIFYVLVQGWWGK